jgi:hypothetical protein
VHSILQQRLLIVFFESPMCHCACGDVLSNGTGNTEQWTSGRYKLRMLTLGRLRQVFSSMALTLVSPSNTLFTSKPLNPKLPDPNSNPNVVMIHESMIP